jgi:hypothetical protein
MTRSRKARDAQAVTVGLLSVMATVIATYDLFLLMLFSR